MLGMYSAEKRQLTGFGKVAAIVGMGSAVLLAEGCGANGTPSDGPSTVYITVAPSTEAPVNPELPVITPTPSPTLPGEGGKIPETTPTPTPSKQVIKAGGRVALGPETCDVWSPAHPGKPIYQKDKHKKTHMLVTVDARANAPKDCDPDTDTGATMRKGASYEAEQADLPKSGVADGAHNYKDGALLEVVGAVDGQFVCNPDQERGGNIWLEVKTPGKHTKGTDPTAWIPIANTEYTTHDQIVEAGIQIQSSPYMNTTAGGC
jgi:hypothetical protein